MKLLAVLVNYGEEQLSYLEEVVNGLKSFNKYAVSIIVQSNVSLSIQGIDKVNVLKLDDYQLLPLTCRKVIWAEKDNYDVFIYGENDHLFLESHVDKYLEYEKILPKNRISGLIQYEQNEKGKYFPGYHNEFEWDYKSIEVYDGLKFAHFTNIHQASFILSKTQLLQIGKKIDFSQLAEEKKISFFDKLLNKYKKFKNLPQKRTNQYSVKCKVNTDIYGLAGLKKMICISEFEDNLIHHLPNIYIDGLKGRNKFRSDSLKMNKAIKKLLKN